MIHQIFIQKATDILGATNGGLKGSEILNYTTNYALQYDVDIPHISMQNAPNKRTVLKENIDAFNPEQQFIILKELCELEQFKGKIDIKDLKIKLITKYGHLNKDIDTVNEVLIDETKHWLNEYSNVLTPYEDALLKYKNNIFERNLLDDLRLSLELLLKIILKNNKSLQNQISFISELIEIKGGSKQLANMFKKLLDYYSKYQNEYVKHNDKVIEEEIEFIFELTSSFMKHFIRINNL